MKAWRTPRWGLALLATLTVGLSTGCGAGSKTVRYELSADDLAKHHHLLLVPGGPTLVKLNVGMAGKLLMKGLNKIVERDKNSSFAQSLHDAGLLPRKTACNKGAHILQGLGWQVSEAKLHIASPRPGFNQVQLPAGACEEAVSTGADSVLILYQRLTIDVGATKTLAVSELWAHYFSCHEKRLLWRKRDKRSLSLTQFALAALKKAIAKESTTLADLLTSLRSTIDDSAQAVLTKGLSRASHSD